MSESLEEPVAVDAPPVDSADDSSDAETDASLDRPMAEPHEPELPLDQTFEILRNERRRRVLRFLKDADDSLSLGDLSERIAALENGKTVNEITSSERKRVYVGLYQCHLPKMDGMDVIEFNKPRGIIEPGPNLDLFDEYIEEDGPNRRPWHLYYGGLSIGGIVALVVAATTQWMLPIPTVVLAAVAICLAFLGLSVFHFTCWWDGSEDTDGPS